MILNPHVTKLLAWISAREGVRQLQKFLTGPGSPAAPAGPEGGSVAQAADVAKFFQKGKA